jgi:hypothetical protein
VRPWLPWFLLNLGVAAKGRRDCGEHDWYNSGGGVERCYHCAAGERPYDSAHLVLPAAATLTPLHGRKRGRKLLGEYLAAQITSEPDE